MNTVPTTMTNPADSHKNHSACAGKRGLGTLLPNKQSAKGATFALLATMINMYLRLISALFCSFSAQEKPETETWMKIDP